MRTVGGIRSLLALLDGKSAEDIESEDLEFKQWRSDIHALHRELRETVVCLANARGGELILGVVDRKRTRRESIQGVGQYDLPSLRRAVYDGTDPHILVDIEELVEPEGTLLVIHVPKGIPPHTTSDGVAKIRVGKDCLPLTGRMLARLLASGGQTDPTGEPVSDASVGHLDPTEIAQLGRVIQQEGQNPGLARLPPAQLLEALGLVVDGRVTLAAILLVGSEAALAKWVPQHEVTFLRFRTRTRYDQRRDLRGPLLAMLRELEQLIAAHTRVTTVQERGLRQLELPDLSWEVAREAALNAVTHRDYFLRQSVQIGLYQERVEVISPGGFIGGVTPENVLRHPPVHRNELLARVLQTIGLVNRVGLGVDRIYEGLLRLGKDIPRYSADEAHVQLVLPIKTHEQFALLVAQEEEKGRPLDLDDLIVLRGLLSVASVDRWSAASLLQLDEQAAAERLVSLRERDYVVSRGRGRGTAYGLARRLADRLLVGGIGGLDPTLEEEGVKLRILALLKQRGRLTNAEIRFVSGFSRTQVLRLLKDLEAEGQVGFEGRGRGAHVVATSRTAPAN